MRISIITEGKSEFASLPKIYDQLRRRTGNIILAPLLVSVAPDASPAVVARECKSRIAIALGSQRPDLIIILLDREQQAEPPGTIASVIENAVLRACGEDPRVRVVLKDRTFENWLVADLDGLESMPARFDVSVNMRRAVEPNRADSCDALGLLKKSARRGYEKIDDSIKIMERYDVGRAARHSRSVRHFLHVLGDPLYASQCRAAVLA